MPHTWSTQRGRTISTVDVKSRADRLSDFGNSFEVVDNTNTGRARCGDKGTDSLQFGFIERRQKPLHRYPIRATPLIGGHLKNIRIHQFCRLLDRRMRTTRSNDQRTCAIERATLHDDANANVQQ